MLSSKNEYRLTRKGDFIMANTNNQISGSSDMIQKALIVEKDNAVIINDMRYVFSSKDTLITALFSGAMSEGDSEAGCGDGIKELISMSITKDNPLQATKEDIESGITYRDLIYRAISNGGKDRTDLEQLVLHEISDSYTYYVKPCLTAGKSIDFLYLPDTAWTRMLDGLDEVRLVMHRYAEEFDPEYASCLQ